MSIIFKIDIHKKNYVAQTRFPAHICFLGSPNNKKLKYRKYISSRKNKNSTLLKNLFCEQSKSTCKSLRCVQNVSSK